MPSKHIGCSQHPANAMLSEKIDYIVLHRYVKSTWLNEESTSYSRSSI